jgi:hypothetical protein
MSCLGSSPSRVGDSPMRVGPDRRRLRRRDLVLWARGPGLVVLHKSPGGGPKPGIGKYGFLFLFRRLETRPLANRALSRTGPAGYARLRSRRPGAVGRICRFEHRDQGRARKSRRTSSRPKWNRKREGRGLGEPWADGSPSRVKPQAKPDRIVLGPIPCRQGLVKNNEGSGTDPAVRAVRVFRLIRNLRIWRPAPDQSAASPQDFLSLRCIVWVVGIQLPGNRK